MTKSNTNTLNNNADWTSGVAPGPGDVASFDATVSAANIGNLNSTTDLSWQGLAVGTINGPAVFNAGYTLTLGSAGINMGAATNSVTFNAGLALLANTAQTWNVAAGQTLTVNGAFTRNAGAALTTIGGAGTITAPNIPVTNGIIGTWAVVNTAGTYNYATVTGGNLVAYTGAIQESTATGAYAGIPSGGDGTVNYDVTVGGTYAATGISRLLNTIRFTGTTAGIQNSNSTSTAGSNVLTINGIMNAGTASLTIGGSPTTTPTATTGRINVTIGQNLELVLAPETASITLNGAILNNAAGASALTVLGNNSAILGGTSTYTGPTTIASGTLVLGIGGTTGSIGLSSGIVDNGVLAFNRTNAVTQGTDFPATPITGTGALVQNGTGVLTFSAPNTFTGGVSINNGSISVDTIGNRNATITNLGIGTTVNLGAATTTGTLTYTGVGETTNRIINLAGTTGGGGINQSGTGPLVFTSDLGISGAGAKTFTLTGSNTGTGEFAGRIVDGSSPTTLSKTGTGTWTVSNANNSFTGGTSITGGVLAVTGATQLSTGAVTLGTGNTNSGGTLQLSNNVTLAAVSAINATGRNAPTATPAGTASIENLSGSNTISAPINFSATGGTYVNVLSTAGTLTLSGPITGTVLITGTAFGPARGFDFYGAGNTVVSGSISNGTTGAVIFVQKDGTGTLTLTNSNTHTGPTAVNGGILAVTANGGLGGGNATVLATATNLTIGVGVTNPFSTMTTTLSLAGGGTANMADVGYLDLTSGATITVGNLVLNGVTEPAGTYNSALFPDYIAGAGSVINLAVAVPEPGTWIMMLGALGGLAGWQAYKRRSVRA